MLLLPTSSLYHCHGHLLPDINSYVSSIRCSCSDLVIYRSPPCTPIDTSFLNWLQLIDCWNTKVECLYILWLIDSIQSILLLFHRIHFKAALPVWQCLVLLACLASRYQNLIKSISHTKVIILFQHRIRSLKSSFQQLVCIWFVFQEIYIAIII